MFNPWSGNEDPTCHGATMPAYHNWRESVHCNKRFCMTWVKSHVPQRRPDTTKETKKTRNDARFFLYPSSPRTYVAQSIYPLFYSIAFLEAFYVLDPISVTADRAVQTRLRSLSSQCLLCSGSSAARGGD